MQLECLAAHYSVKQPDYEERVLFGMHVSDSSNIYY